MEVSAARRTAYERAVAAVRDSLGEEHFTAAWKAGRALSLDQTVAEATALVHEASTTDGNDASAAAAGLTERERAVLRLLVRGRPDKEIAATLGISRRTVSNHIVSIRAKLAAPSRAAAAAIAVRDRLL